MSLKAGVYHFFEKLDYGGIKSLYVGKSTFTPPNDNYKNGWNLYERLKQHFHEKGDGLLRQYLKHGYPSSTAMKDDLIKRGVYFQWAPLYSKQPNNLILDSATCERQKREIILCEHFCISMLHPEFNDR